VVAALVWAACIIWALFSLGRAAPVMAVIGVVLAAVPPVLFVAGVRRWALVSPRDPHPVMVSVASGFGVVLTMVAVNRYGEQFETHVIAAALALALWLIWVRWVWRAMFGSGSEQH